MKNKNRFIKIIIYFALFTLLLIFVALSPVFVIKKIEVRGNNHYKTEDIIGVTDIMLGQNWFRTIEGKIGDIFLFRNSSAEENILRDRPFIKTVQVKYAFLSKTVFIDIVGRQPLFIVPYLSMNLLVDNEGFVLDAINNVNIFHLPVVRGLKFDKYELGKRLEVTNSQNLKAMYNVASTIIKSDLYDKKELYCLITNIDVSDLCKLCLAIDTRIMVELGDYNCFNDYKIDFLKQVFFTKISKEDKGLLTFSSNQGLKFIPYYEGGNR